MYLIGFVLFVVLGKRRARQNLLTGWHPRDVDDMLFYGVFGVILGGRLGYVLFYKPLYYLAHPLEILSDLAGRHELPRRLSRRPGRALALRARRGKRWLDVTDFVAPLSRSGSPPAASAISSTANCGGAPTDVPWGMVFPQAGPAAAASVAALPVRPARACCSFAVLWIFTRRPRPLGAVSGLFLIGYGAVSLRRRVRARARRLPGLSRARPDDGTVAVAADDRRRRDHDALGVPARRARPQPTVLDRMK